MKQEMIGDVPGNVLGMMADLAHKLQHGVITPTQLSLFLKKENPYATPRTVEEMVIEQQEFYRTAFGIDCDFSSVAIPERREGFDRLIVVADGISAERVYQQCKKEFLCWKYTDRSLDETVPTNERDPKNGTYAIWVRDTVEADEEHKNKSAEDIADEELPTETLVERLLHELKYFRETGKHLDLTKVTLCAGSRGSVGSVPIVYWGGSRLNVDWYSPDVAARGDLRAREVVS